MANATPTQVASALHLLDEAGYDTRYMNSSFAGLGATMRRRSGSVEGWLESMNRVEISKLIDRLKEDDD